jgi:hypothetical protein
MRKPMDRPHRPAAKAVAAAIALILLLAAAVYALGASPSRGTFEIHGSAGALLLAPGRAAPLDLRLTNPNLSVMRIDELAVRLEHIDAPEADARRRCTADDFAVVQYSGEDDVELPRSSTHTLSSLGIPVAHWPQILMANRPVNQDGCKNASLRLSYTAKSTRGRP